jgi:ribosomal protein S18 acetylase RimI-like enzyme
VVRGAVGVTEVETERFRILFPIPDDEDGALVLHHVAGGRAALQHFLGPPERRRRVFARTVARDRVIGAVADGRSLGFASFKLEGRGPYAPNFSDFRAEYGGIAGVFLYLVFAYAEWRDRSPDLYLYGLNVIPEARRQGVATALLEAVAAAAVKVGACKIELEVGSHNEKAVKLYLSQGFVATKVLHLGPLARWFPFASLTRMELLLRGEGQRGVRPERP